MGHQSIVYHASFSISLFLAFNLGFFFQAAEAVASSPAPVKRGRRGAKSAASPKQSPKTVSLKSSSPVKRGRRGAKVASPIKEVSPVKSVCGRRAAKASTPKIASPLVKTPVKAVRGRGAKKAATASSPIASPASPTPVKAVRGRGAKKAATTSKRIASPASPTPVKRGRVGRSAHKPTSPSPVKVTTTMV